MNKIGKRSLVVLYAMGLIFTTIYLYSLNKFGYANFFGRTVFSSYNNEEFKNGSLVLVLKDKIAKGDVIVYYNSYDASYDILIDKVIDYEVTNEFETTYFLSNERYLSSSYLIGSVDDSIEIPFLGYVFSFLSSKFAYFFIYVIPIWGLMLYQIIHITKFKTKR